MRIRLKTLFSFILNLTVVINTSFIEAQETEKFVVLRTSPSTKEQLDVVRELHDNMHKYDLDFWLTPIALGHKADIMIRTSRLNWLEGVLTNYSIPYNLTIKDVQQLILDREHKPRRSSSTKFSRRLNDEGGNRAKYGLGEYHSYDHIVTWMEEIERFYPDKAKVVNIGTTEEGRPIKGIKIGSGVHRTDKRIVWIDGGIHAREWAAVHTVIYIIDRLIADYDTDPLVREAVDQLNFYLFPVLNPDGYEFSRSGISPLIRLWRKNRSSMLCKKDLWFRERCCGGVDLNRNFDWFWGEIGSSNDRCSEIYQGKEAFSEAESRAVRDAMLSPEMRGKVDAFLTLHTYSQMWIHPFSHQRKTVPEDISDIEQVGRKALSALENVYGTKYRFGTGADILYPSSGGSDDWAKGKIGAKYVYLMELRPSEEVWDGFILDSRQLVPTGRETWAGIKVVIQAVLKLSRELSSTSPTVVESIVNVPSPSMTTSPNTSFTSRTAATTLTTNRIDPMLSRFVSTSSSAQFDNNKSFSVPQSRSPTAITAIATKISPFITTTMIPTRYENVIRATNRPVVRVLQNGRRKWIRVLSQHSPARVIDMSTSLVNVPVPKPFTADPKIQPNQQISQPTEMQSVNVNRVQQQPTNIDMMRRLSRKFFIKRKRISTSGSLTNHRMKSTKTQRWSTKGIDTNSTTQRVSAIPFNTPPLAIGTPIPPTFQTCSDRSVWCRAWLDRNPRVCSISSVFMRRECSRTCQFC